MHSTSPLAESSPSSESRRWVKVDFHLHAAEDPLDELDYSVPQLLHRAKRLGFEALAITLHDHVFQREETDSLARALGIELIPAAEIRIEGADVVLLNLSLEEAHCLTSFEALRALRKARGPSLFVVAPHPFYHLGGSIGQRLLRHLDLFDAIEICHFHTRFLDFNAKARTLAEATQIPLLATSDAHRLGGFGHHYALLEAPDGFSREDLFESVRRKRIRNVSPPYSLPKYLEHAWWIFARHNMRLLQARLAGER